MKDFPAAHSNDTDWFAVDEEGNIALFEALAEGASPNDYNDETIYEDIYELSNRERVIILKCDFPIKKFPELLNPRGNFKSADQKKPSYAYLFLINDQSIISVLAPGVASMYFPRLSDSKSALLITPVVFHADYEDQVNELIKDEKIIGFAGVDPTIDFYNGVLKNLPIFRYEPEDGGYTHPYKRIHKPKRALNIKDITYGFPIRRKEKLKTCFYQEDRIQLMEIGYSLGDIYTVGTTGWVALDGKIYDFDGNFLGIYKASWN